MGDAKDDVRELTTNSEERWKSEGIQIGGPRAARGVLGHWFDKYDSHLPSLFPSSAPSTSYPQYICSPP